MRKRLATLTTRANRIALRKVTRKYAPPLKKKS